MAKREGNDAVATTPSRVRLLRFIRNGITGLRAAAAAAFTYEMPIYISQRECGLRNARYEESLQIISIVIRSLFQLYYILYITKYAVYTVSSRRELTFIGNILIKKNNKQTKM